MMFPRFQERTGVWPLLVGLVVVAMCSNSAVWVLCRHVSGRLDHCFEQSAAHSHKDIKGSHVEHMHADAMQMSDMDLHGRHKHAFSIVHTESPNFEPANSVIVAVTESRNSCSHCLTHSRVQANLSWRTDIVNCPSYDGIEPDSSTEIVRTLSWVIIGVEIHDHGPPGSNDPRYILNSAYRI
jgi:hypothetical protein